VSFPIKSLLAAAALFCAAGPARLSSAEGSPARADEALAALEAAPGDRERLLRAVELLADPAAGRSAALEAAARRLLAKDPSDYAGYLALCKHLRGAGRPQEAVSNCRRALELDPTLYPVYRELGLSYAAAGTPRKASETLEQGVELSSSSYKARYDLARLFEARGDFERAALQYKRALPLAAADKGEDGAYYHALIKAGSRRTAGKRSAAKPRPVTKRAEPAPAAKASPAETENCLDKFKTEFLKDNLGSALAQSEACLKLLPSSAPLAAERAPLLVRLGRYEEGVKEYERAAGLYSPNPQMAAFCRMKAAETWLKLGDSAKAVAQYRLALKANPRDLNALKGLAAAQEARSDLKGALETYDEILKAAPGDERARIRREELRAGSLTDKEILAELLLRQAVDPVKAAPTQEDLKLFKNIRAAELAGGVDYVRGKAPSAKGLLAQRKAGEGTRVALTAAGYKAYVFHATRDAIKFLEGEGIGLREMFQLRTLAGEKIFDAAGKLTPEGEEFWRNSSKGEKTWLLPYDAVPASPQAVQANKEITELEKSGYREISEPEYLWLLKVTTCPEDVLKTPPLNVKEIRDGARSRYMLCYQASEICMTNENIKLPQLVEQYRSGEADLAGGDSHTGFFGGAASKKRHFCENGSIWRGD
jgi:tetratricopeptide (TPR) repeat protein